MIVSLPTSPLPQGCALEYDKSDDLKATRLLAEICCKCGWWCAAAVNVQAVTSTPYPCHATAFQSRRRQPATSRLQHSNPDTTHALHIHRNFTLTCPHDHIPLLHHRPHTLAHPHLSHTNNGLEDSSAAALRSRTAPGAGAGRARPRTHWHMEQQVKFDFHRRRTHIHRHTMSEGRQALISTTGLLRPGQ